MATKTVEKPVVKNVGDPNLAGKEWGECAGNPLVDVKLPYLEPDENNVKPDQTFHYTFNGNDYTIERGRNKRIPRDHFLILRVGMPNL